MTGNEAQHTFDTSGPVNRLPEFVHAAKDMREMAIGNLVLVGEIPAPTFQEKRRTQEFVHRLIDCGIQDCSVDEVGNGIGIIPGESGEQNILLAANADSIHGIDIDHAISVQPDHLIGCGLSTSLGVGTLATLPMMMDSLGIKLRSNLILLATARSAGRGNLEGIRYFLANNKYPVSYGICLKGSPLGRLSYSSIGMVRADITCRVPSEYDWTRFGASGAVLTMNQIISNISAIPLPRKPVTNIVLGSIDGGSTYDRIARQVVLKFEIRSEDAAMVHSISEQIDDIVAETAAQSGAEITLNVFAHREPGGIQIGHPLVRCCRTIMNALQITPRIMPSTSEHSALIDNKIPAVTLGISTSESISDEQDQLKISPMYKGLAQVLAAVLAVDGGLSA